LAQITSVTSEALQAEVRRLLPSQQGFGEDLQASNVITPIIDLTNVAEGTNVPQYQAQALNFGGITAFDVGNATTTIINTPGFFIVRGVFYSDTTVGPQFNITDGATTKLLFNLRGQNAANNNSDKIYLQFYVFVRAGDSVTCANNNATFNAQGTTQQLADVNGVTTLPTGFTPQ